MAINIHIGKKEEAREEKGKLFRWFSAKEETN